MIPIFGFGKAGGYKVLTKLANYWKSQNHKVVFVVTTDNQKPYYNVDCEIVFLYKNKEEIPKSKYFLFIKNIIILTKYIKKHFKEYDVIMANWCFTAYPVWFASKTLNLYYIQAYEPEFFNETRNLLKKYIYKLLSWLTYYLPLIRVVNSDYYTKYKNITAKYVVYPGIDLNVFYPKKTMIKANNDIFKIGCIGRLEQWKGSQDVADAIGYLYNKGIKNIKFLVAFNRVNCSNYEVVYPDNDESLANFYRNLDILVAPGHIQLNAIHYPVIEAMAVKTPVITTGYYPANTSNAFIVPIKSPKNIAEKIEYLMQYYSDAVEKADKAYNEIQKFSWNVVGDNFLKIILQEKGRKQKTVKS